MAAVVVRAVLPTEVGARGHQNQQYSQANPDQNTSSLLSKYEVNPSVYLLRQLEKLITDNCKVQNILFSKSRPWTDGLGLLGIHLQAPRCRSTKNRSPVTSSSSSPSKLCWSSKPSKSSPPSTTPSTKSASHKADSRPPVTPAPALPPLHLGPRPTPTTETHCSNRSTRK
jgi:hypothetical protein